MRIQAVIRLLRTRQWIKNGLIFTAPFFSGQLFSKDNAALAFVSFIAFSICSSAGYVFNDIADRAKDMHHPDKRHRPIASGEISITLAYSSALVLLVTSLLLSFTINLLFFYFVLLYAAIQFGYTVSFKNKPLIDIFIIASGFVIRVLAGGAAFLVKTSSWLLVTMFMVSLMLAAGKRYAELMLLNAEATKHRVSLIGMTTPFLNDILLITGSSALISYALYTVEESPELVYTVPLVTFGLFRYIYLTKGGKGDPTDAFTRDRWLIVSMLLWLLVVALTRYKVLF